MSPRNAAAAAGGGGGGGGSVVGESAVVSWGRWLLMDRRGLLAMAVLLLLGETLLNALIIRFVSYTEIDWRAYMQEVAGPMEHGDYDYANLRGDTGPLVYPAGFVWLYSILYYATDKGSDIAFAQYIFMVLYLVFIAVVFATLQQVKQVKPWLLILFCMSRRIHSIFVLRLFNDCWAMLFLWCALYCFVRYRWAVGCFLFSVAVSIKMNVLLFAPALLVLLVQSFGVLGSVPYLTICALWQILSCIPFLLANPIGYLVGSFNFGRKFFYIWTVNWKFLPEEVFLSTRLAVVLLVAHLVVLVLFAVKYWCKPTGGLLKTFSQLLILDNDWEQMSPHHILKTLLVGNFIGIVFCRSLHFQFYVWYYHSLPYLLFLCTDMPMALRFGLLLVIEIVWNIFPSAAIPSLVLQISHYVILGALWWYAELPPRRLRPGLQVHREEEKRRRMEKRIRCAERRERALQKAKQT